MTSPIVPPNQTEEEKQYVLVVTTSVRSLNWEMTSVILGDMVTTLAGGGVFWDPCMATILPGPIRERGVIGNQCATVKELGENDTE